MPDAIAPKNGKIGGVKKEYVYAGVAVGGVLVVTVYMRSKKAAATAANAATVTDPAGNVCAALNPVSGYCPGTPQDLSYTGTGSTLAGQNSASYVGGQVIGYDQYGNPIYSSSTNAVGVPGSYTNNAQWTQAAISSLQSSDPNTSSDVISAALGVYISGNPATSDQQSIIQQAIAQQGFPPVAGTNGYPPSIKNAPPVANTGGGTTSTLAAPGMPNVSPSKTSAKVSWSAIAGATGYTVVYWRLSGGAAFTKNVSGTSYTMTGLLSKQKYDVYVYATNSTQKGAHSAPNSFTTT